MTPASNQEIGRRRSLESHIEKTTLYGNGLCFGRSEGMHWREWHLTASGNLSAVVFFLCNPSDLSEPRCIRKNALKLPFEEREFLLSSRNDHLSNTSIFLLHHAQNAAIPSIQVTFDILIIRNAIQMQSKRRSSIPERENKGGTMLPM